MTKEFTITIQPCKEPVTITIHADKEPVITPPDADPRRSPEVIPEIILDGLVQRTKIFFEQNNGYCRRSQFTTRFQADRRVRSIRDDLFDHLGVLVFYVLPPSGSTRILTKPTRWPRSTATASISDGSTIRLQRPQWGFRLSWRLMRSTIR